VDRPPEVSGERRGGVHAPCCAGEGSRVSRSFRACGAVRSGGGGGGGVLARSSVKSRLDEEL
jgi:hypothetical protein